MATTFVPILLCVAVIGAAMPGQEPPGNESAATGATSEDLAQRVDALRHASGPEEVVDAWWELEQFVAAATALPAVLRTDALGEGIGIEPEVLQLRVIGALGTAPDGPRAAHYLLAACRLQGARERKLAADKWRPKLDPDEARILGFKVSADAFKLGELTNDMDGAIVLRLREALIGACRSNAAPDATRGLVELVRALGPTQEVEPVIAILLERDDEVVPDGVLALFEAAEPHHDRLRDAVKEAKQWRPRPVPKGIRKSEWEKSEKQVKKRLVNHREWRVARFGEWLDAMAADVAAYAKSADLPSPPKHGLPLAAWQRWRNAVAKALERRAGKAETGKG